jgi:hypothetical protein
MRNRGAKAEEVSGKLRKELEQGSYPFVVLQYDGTLKTISNVEVVRFGNNDEPAILLS